jgi:hypothetical protein
MFSLPEHCRVEWEYEPNDDAEAAFIGEEVVEEPSDCTTHRPAGADAALSSAVSAGAPCDINTSLVDSWLQQCLTQGAPERGEGGNTRRASRLPPFDLPTLAAWEGGMLASPWRYEKYLPRGQEDGTLQRAQHAGMGADEGVAEQSCYSPSSAAHTKVYAYSLQHAQQQQQQQQQQQGQGQGQVYASQQHGQEQEEEGTWERDGWLPVEILSTSDEDEEKEEEEEEGEWYVSGCFPCHHGGSLSGRANADAAASYEGIKAAGGNAWGEEYSSAAGEGGLASAGEAAALDPTPPSPSMEQQQGQQEVHCVTSAPRPLPSDEEVARVLAALAAGQQAQQEALDRAWRLHSVCSDEHRRPTYGPAPIPHTTLKSGGGSKAGGEEAEQRGWEAGAELEWEPMDDGEPEVETTGGWCCMGVWACVSWEKWAWDDACGVGL